MDLQNKITSYKKKPKAMQKNQQKINKFHNVELKIPECCEYIKISVLLKLRVTMKKMVSIKQDQKIRKRRKLLEQKTIEMKIR